MGRRVFVSFLGTGNYVACRYSSAQSGYCSEPVRFIQEATLETLGCEKWDSSDLALIMLTPKSRAMNWLCDGQRRFDTKEIIRQDGLEKRLMAMGLPIAIEAMEIPEGNDEGEIWSIFELLFNRLESGDRLYFDITHGFRYLPMLVLALAHYAKFLKGVSLEMISYGNYESRNSDNVAPIIDLTAISVLQDWTTAAGEFIEMGSAKRMVSLIDETIRPVLKQSKGKDLEAYQLKGLALNLKQVSGMLSTCRGFDIIDGDLVEKSSKLIESLEQHLIKPLNPLLERVRVRLDEFQGRDNLMNGLVAASWCLDNGMVQQSITIAYEALVSLVCVIGGMDMKIITHRDIASSSLSIVAKEELRSNPSRWKLHGRDEESKQYSMDRYKEFVDTGILDPLVDVYNVLLSLRNDINHCGMVHNVTPQGSFEPKMRESIVTLNDVFDSLLNSSSKFINFSNHPIDSWSDLQRVAAQEYGECVDIAFPSVAPEMDSSEIALLAKEYSELIVGTIGAAVKGSVVHVMGEMTLAHGVIDMLRNKGVRCVSATSERMVSETAQGVKEITFRFVRFRDYVDL
ncbi:MAG: TIGR02221 family CRISPR-associated protein [Bacteroidales bacterium]